VTPAGGTQPVVCVRAKSPLWWWGTIL